MVCNLEDALLVIPIFDGDNLSISEFFLARDGAFAILKYGWEDILIKCIIRTKLSGEVKEFTSLFKYNSLNELKDFLRRYFGPKKSEYELLGELGKIFQAEDESLISFAARIRNIQSDLIEIYMIQKPNEQDLTFYKNNLERMLVESFHRGVETPIEIRLYKQGVFTKFNDIFMSALAIKRELEEKKIRIALSRRKKLLDLYLEDDSHTQDNKTYARKFKEEISFSTCDTTYHTNSEFFDSSVHFQSHYENPKKIKSSLSESRKRTSTNSPVYIEYEAKKSNIFQKRNFKCSKDLNDKNYQPSNYYQKEYRDDCYNPDYSTLNQDSSDENYSAEEELSSFSKDDNV